MSKQRILIVIALAILAIVLIIVIKSQNDESPPVTDEVRRQMRSEWEEMGPLAQEMVCNIWNDPNRNELIAAFGAMDESDDEESSPAELEAGLEIMNEEC